MDLPRPPPKIKPDSTAHAVARALTDNAEEMAAALLGAPSHTSPHEQRWGSRGSLSLRRSGAKRGLWFDHESGEGGDLLHLIRREHNVQLGDAIKIAQRDY